MKLHLQMTYRTHQRDRQINENPGGRAAVKSEPEFAFELTGQFGGDIGWNTVHEVQDGEVGELVLGKEELAWLPACWKAATAGRRS